MDYKSEDIYKLLQESKFEKLLDIENKHRKDIIKDPVLKQVFDVYFIDAILNYTDNKKEKLDCYLLLKKVYTRFIHHREKTYSIPNEKFEKLVVSYLKNLKSIDELDLSYTIAKKWTHIKYAQDLIIEYEKNHSKELKHSSSDTMKVSINPNIKKANHTIPLLKSKQEYEFFYAVKESHPNFYTYPNVAISCIIDFNKIKNDLNIIEKDYFFKAIVDSVVYEEIDNNFIPKYYFEIDSIYHDNKEQKNKDKMKDKFFSLAGQELIRIRGKNNTSLTRNDFKKMIKELLN